MTFTSFFWALGDLLGSMLSLFDADGMMTTIVGNTLILSIAFGLLRWLLWQKKLNTQAEADENQLK